jgi:hypothetical protein
MIRDSEHGQALRITSFDSRALAAAGACGPAVLAIVAGVFVFGPHTGSDAYRYRPLAAVALVLFAVAASWGVVRAARVSTEFGPEGVVVRNPWRTTRIAWDNVAWFGNGTVHQGEAGNSWALAIGIATPTRSICCHSTAPTKRCGMGEIKTAIQPLAAAHGIPERFNDSATTVAPGQTWLYDKLRLRRKH